MKEVKLVQGIWCDLGRHVIKKDEPYLTLPTGLLVCPECAYKEDENSRKAGALA